MVRFENTFFSLIGVDKWKSDDNDAVCPDNVVPGKGPWNDYSGDCSRILSTSPNKLEGGECKADTGRFICQKKKGVKLLLSNEING